VINRSSSATDLPCLVRIGTDRHEPGPTGPDIEIDLGDGFAVHKEFCSGVKKTLLIAGTKATYAML
jgi:hypothetical protein